LEAPSHLAGRCLDFRGSKLATGREITLLALLPPRIRLFANLTLLKAPGTILLPRRLRKKSSRRMEGRLLSDSSTILSIQEASMMIAWIM
jgi:hypothetical protein